MAAFFVVGATIAGCGSSVPGNSVATVAGNPLTVQAYNHWMYIAAKEYAAQAAGQGLTEPVITDNNPNNFKNCMKELRIGVATLKTSPDSTLKTACKSVFTQYNTEILNYLLESYWLQAQAHKEGISVGNLDTKFAKYLKTQYPTKGELANVMAQSGQTRQDLAFQFRLTTLYGKLLKKYEKPVTAAAIAKYYAAHKTQFGTPESRDLRLIRTKTQAQAQAAMNALKSGQSWDTVAKTYAADATTKANGGLLSGVTSGEEESAVNTAIFSNPVNKLVGPVKGIFGYYVLESLKITPAVQQSLADATKTIKSDLTTAEAQAASTKVIKVAKANWFKKTTCRVAFATVAVCSNYTAPKTTTSTTPTSTPTTPTTSSTSTKTATTATKTSTTK